MSLTISRWFNISSLFIIFAKILEISDVINASVAVALIGEILITFYGFIFMAYCLYHKLNIPKCAGF